MSRAIGGPLLEAIVSHRDRTGQRARRRSALSTSYVRPEFRGRKYGELLVDHLAGHGASGVTLLRLETGIHQQAAIRLYERLGFRRIPPFGPYTEDPLSRCYEKSLASA